MLADTELVKRFREKTTVPLIGESSIFLLAITQATKLARSKLEFPVLIVGETGTGKELLARAIHDSSPRAGKIFLPVNCSAITDDLFESTVFGHEKGSFTGALRDHNGYIDAAGDGSLFLDEIGDMTLQNQVKMLRVLDEGGQYTPVGSNEVKKNRSRIIVATNRDLNVMISERQFREDLLYRLETYLIFIPPLRDRKEDIPLLVQFFLEQMGLQQVTLTKKSWNILSDYDWPGNIRELQNLVRRMVVWHQGEEEVEIKPEDLDLRRLNPLTTGGIEGLTANIATTLCRDYKAGKRLSLDEIGKLIAMKVIKICEGNKTQASEILGKTVKTLRAWTREE